MIEKSLKILVQVFCFGVLGGVLGDALWRSVSSAFARWCRISSPVVGFTSGLSASSPVRLEPFAGLRASSFGAGNHGSCPSPVSIGVGRWVCLRFIQRLAPPDGSGREDLLPVATAFSGGGWSGRKMMMGCLKCFFCNILFF